MKGGASLIRASPSPLQFRGRFGRLRVRGPRLALGGRAHTRPQLPRLRRGLRGQLHCGAPGEGCASHRAGRAPWLRSARRPPAARLPAAWPPPARAHRLSRGRALQPAAHLAALRCGEFETPHSLGLRPSFPHKPRAQPGPPTSAGPDSLL